MMFKNIKEILLLLIFFSSLSASSIINITDASQDILSKCEIYIDANSLDLKDIKKMSFNSSSQNHINLGFAKKTSIWLRFTLQNTSDKEMLKVLEVLNPLLEKITLYDKGIQSTRGMLYIQKYQTSINPSFEITLKAHENKTYYLHVTNTTTALQFSLLLKEKEQFLYDEDKQKMLIMIFFGIIIALLIYNLFLYLFTKNRAYIYYTLYLFALIS